MPPHAGFLCLVASHLASQPSASPKEKAYLDADLTVATTGVAGTSLRICGTDPAKVQRVAFPEMSIGRIKPLLEQEEGRVVAWAMRMRGR